MAVTRRRIVIAVHMQRFPHIPVEIIKIRHFPLSKAFAADNVKRVVENDCAVTR